MGTQIARVRGMHTTEAAALANTLRASGNNHTIRAEIVGNEWITFVGGSHGCHSLSIPCSSKERVLAHWSGYCANNGVVPPPSPPLIAVGHKANFPSASAPNGYRIGVVVKVTRTRCLIEYRYKYQDGVGPCSTKWCKHAEVQDLGRANMEEWNARKDVNWRPARARR